MENQTNLKWYQKPNGVIILLILFFPVGLYQMWKNQMWTKKTRIIISVFIILSVVVATSNENSNSFSNISSSSSSSSSSSDNSDIYGEYSDFSNWYSGISGKIIVNSSSWSGYISDNGDFTRYKGITNGTDLLDETGTAKIGYLSDGKVYIYYLNSFNPVGR
jgi:hypothetical protein